MGRVNILNPAHHSHPLTNANYNYTEIPPPVRMEITKKTKDENAGGDGVGKKAPTNWCRQRGTQRGGS